MASVDNLIKRMTTLQQQLEPPKPRDTRLPYLVLSSGDGKDYPGYQQHNAEHRKLARRLRIPANVYIDFDPFVEEGCEP